MFRISSRRISAYLPRPVQTSRTLTRSIHAFNVRPTLQSKPGSANSLSRSYPHPRCISMTQRVRLKFREASKGIFRKNPILLPLAVVSVVGGIVAFAYISYVEVTRVNPQYTKFPPPVADSLRTAIYYTEIDLNPAKALKSYKEALRLAIEMDLHPFSDEVLGIKLQVAMMLEKAGLVKPAIDVLERTKNETLSWIAEARNAESVLFESKKPNDAKTHKKLKTENVQINLESPEDKEKELLELQEFEVQQRDRALKKVVGIQMKLAELYASDHIQDEKKAEAAQVAAVELCLKEMRRREKLGLPVGGGNTEGAEGDSWLNMSEIATALAELASTYTTKERYDLALPLYLRALDMIRAVEGDSTSCKQVVLLNDVASAMAGQLQQPSRTQQKQSVSREQSVEAARQWALKSLEVAAHIAPPIRDEECDLTCVVATYNLGELAELQKKPNVAQQRYAEAKSLAQALGYEEGNLMADAALNRLSKQ